MGPHFICDVPLRLGLDFKLAPGNSMVGSLCAVLTTPGTSP